MDWHPYIAAAPDRAGGAPTVAGTRLRVDFLLGLLAAGWTPAQLLESHPTLTLDARRAVFACSVGGLRDEALFARPG